MGYADQCAAQERSAAIIKKFTKIQNLDLDLLHSYFRGVLSEHDGINEIQEREDVELFKITKDLRDIVKG